MALAAVLEGLSNGIALLNPDVYDQLRFWQAGSLDIRTLETLKVVVIPVMIAAAVALGLSRALNSLSLGSDTATALGNRVARTQLTGLVVITVLCGSATAVVGPIAFIGLMMPHLSRWLVGADHRWSLPVTLLATPALLLFADVVGRLLVPGELRVSVVSAFIGAPVLIFRYDVNAEVTHDGPLSSFDPQRFAAGYRHSDAGDRKPVQRRGDARSGPVFNALTGSAPRAVTMVVTEWRLPRVAMAMLVGAALGVSGAIFQSLMRNPLGSPDVMGLNTGAWSGVLVAMVLFGQHLTAITVTAMTGGILTALVIWLLARRNGIDTFRLIIIGIGVRAMLMAFNTGCCCRLRWKRRCRPGCGMPVPSTA